MKKIFWILFAVVFCVVPMSGGTWEELSKLMANDQDNSEQDKYGNSVSISGDYAIVGAHQEDQDVSGSNTMYSAGSAYVFYWNGVSWAQQAKLVASDRAVGDLFGYSVSISGDYAIVGAIMEDEDASGNNNMSQSGSAYIFKRNGTIWTQQAKLVASDRDTSDNFGWSVSISGDYAVIGACNDDADNNSVSSAGSAYIFKRDGTIWTQQAKLVASNRERNALFGYSVSISGDYAIVGAFQESKDASDSNILNGAGSAYIFKRDDTSWNQQAKIVASDRAENDKFGYSVSISGDYAIVGAHNEQQDVLGNDSLYEAGSAYIFKRDDTSWNQQTKIVASDRAKYDEFGYSVSISDDHAIVGAHNENEDASGNNTLVHDGAVYIFKRYENSWIQQEKQVASNRQNHAHFGSCVSINGNHAIVGAPDQNYGSGAAYIFATTEDSYQNITTLAELRNIAEGVPVRYTGMARVTFSQDWRGQTYLQDATAAIMIDDYNGLITTDFQRNDGITNLSGSNLLYGNMLEFQPSENAEKTDAPPEINPQIIEISELNSNFDDYESELITLKNVYFPDAGTIVTGGSQYPLTNGTDTVMFRATFYDVDYIDSALPSTICDITGLPNARSTGNFFTPRDFADIVKHEEDVIESDPPAIGDGSSLNPYQITSLENLRWIAENMSRWDDHYIQINNINASETASWDQGKGWLPIGSWSINRIVPFSGSYDGQGYSVDSLYINRPDSVCIGLFGYVAEAPLKNIILTNTDITGYEQVGSIAGWFDYDTLSNCYSSGSVSGISIVGGLVGGIGDTSAIPACITECYTNCSVSGDLGVGGLVAYALYGSSINNSYCLGTVNGNSRTGGLLGLNLQSTVNCSYSISQVNASGNHVGGLVGYDYGGVVNTSFWDTQISGMSNSEGGTGLSSSDMKNETTFTDSGWNFIDIWSMGSDYNNGYPVLQWYYGKVGIKNNDLPASIILNNNIPNPFNPMTTIGYELLSDSDVELSIYDMNGKKIITLVNDHISAGNHKINWDASGYSSGVYLYRLNARGIVITKKMVLLK
jgi:hypothetical protein